jgi:prepilin peptidase CpaA
LERGRVEITPSHVTGLIAVAVSTYFLVTKRDDLSIVAASIYFTLACTTDTFKSKIPNLLSACLLVVGITISSLTLGAHGFLLSLSGLGLGIALLLPFYLMGGMGAGDVKALGALGALIGPYDILHVFIYMGLYGGGLALLHYLYQPNIKETLRNGWLSVCASALTQKADYILPKKPLSHKDALRFPYSAAIALGYYSFIYWGGIL